MNFISTKTYADYLRCLDKDLKNDLIFQGLTVTKDNGDLTINEQVVIHLDKNPHAVIRFTCLGEPKLYGQFILCNDDECVSNVMGNDPLETYGDIVLKMDLLRGSKGYPDYTKFSPILDIVGETIYDITELCFPRKGGKKSRKSKSRKAKSRKSKSRKSKSRKSKPRKSKSRKSKSRKNN
jgi:hypothetical protein